MSKIKLINSNPKDQLEQYLTECRDYKAPIDSELANSILKNVIKSDFRSSSDNHKNYMSILESVRFIERQNNKQFIESAQLIAKNEFEASAARTPSSFYSEANIAISILNNPNPYISFLNRIEEQRRADNSAGLTMAIVDICQGAIDECTQRDVFHTAGFYADALIKNKEIPLTIPKAEILIDSIKNTASPICHNAFEAITLSLKTALDNIQPSLDLK